MFIIGVCDLVGNFKFTCFFHSKFSNFLCISLCSDNFDHLVISVDIDFMIKSTSEHLYHCYVYSFNNADWDGFCDYLQDVPWLDIFGHNINKVGKEISNWIQIGIDCFLTESTR